MVCREPYFITFCELNRSSCAVGIYTLVGVSDFKFLRYKGVCVVYALEDVDVCGRVGGVVQEVSGDKQINTV